MMNKRVKRISLVLVVMVALSVFMTTALAEDVLQIAVNGWKIPGDKDRSGVSTWTATKDVTSTKANKNLYARTGAKVMNQGAETTYFFVVPSATAQTSDRVVATNAGNYGNLRGFNFSCKATKKYGLWHQRYDTTLNTDIVQGKTSLYAK